ncbi:HEAT repeat domain-containing protein [Streptomyces sp. NPDC050145]|uniref:HEAT repeat domain-containing protein n=1 Tax=Streptomyces sp. NPDC050145 TaxID=3365602 RepID=UPI0037879195
MSALRAALGDAASPDWQVRADAAAVLTPWAHVPEAAKALTALLHDPSDTAVTRRAAEALIGGGSVDAARLVARAFAHADDQQADWMAVGVTDAAAVAGDRAAICVRLTEPPEPEDVRRGAAELLSWLRPRT